jgi:hypothetical protein
VGTPAVAILYILTSRTRFKSWSFYRYRKHFGNLDQWPWHVEKHRKRHDWNWLRRDVLDTTLCDIIFQWLAAGQWFSQSTLVSFTNKTDCHDITEILLKVVLNTRTLNIVSMYNLVCSFLERLLCLCNAIANMDIMLMLYLYHSDVKSSSI